MSTLKINLHGFKYFKSHIFFDKSMDNELFNPGLDKATNYACFICISHVRYEAFVGLNEHEFEPCCNDSVYGSLAS